jgi:hypothetical protein
VPVEESAHEHEQLREELKSFRWKRINTGKEIFISLKLSLGIRLTETDQFSSLVFLKVWFLNNRK